MSRQTPPAPPASPAGAPRIDRERFEPPYYQLAHILRQQIASGELRPGDRVPSEVQLCERYGVSPMTARRALNILLDEGLVTAARGRGTFVKPLVLGAATFGLHALEELFSGERTSVRFLSVRTIPSTPRIHQRLGVPVDDKVIAIRRLLSRDSAPVAYHREYLVFDPARPVVEAEMGITSLGRACSRAGARRCSSGATCRSRRRCSPRRKRGCSTQRSAAPRSASSTPSTTLRTGLSVGAGLSCAGIACVSTRPSACPALLGRGEGPER